ncbi:MAG: hypothetical protein QTN59_15395 [Candidatus Electrothrix communis]|nr:MAG: hypothetical protein QTN59_15395 [Candidatus Electrothrix communis]
MKMQGVKPSVLDLKSIELDRGGGRLCPAGYGLDGQFRNLYSLLVEQPGNRQAWTGCGTRELIVSGLAPYVIPCFEQ